MQIFIPPILKLGMSCWLKLLHIKASHFVKRKLHQLYAISKSFIQMSPLSEPFSCEE